MSLLSRKVHVYHKIWNMKHPGDKINSGDGYCIHHIDGDYTNNEVSNLCKMKIGAHHSLHNIGKRHTEKTKAIIGIKNSIRLKGKPGRPQSEETRKKLSEFAKKRFPKNHGFFAGKHHSTATKNKIAAARRGMQFTEMHKRHLSESKKAYYQKLKNESTNVTI